MSEAEELWTWQSLLLLAWTVNKYANMMKKQILPATIKNVVILPSASDWSQNYDPKYPLLNFCRYLLWMEWVTCKALSNPIFCGYDKCLPRWVPLMAGISIPAN